MAQFYTNENFALQVVVGLRRLGHDVVTSLEAANANTGVPDDEVLQFAASHNRILLTYNRRDFLRLHHHCNGEHAGMVICSFDPNFVRQARRIHDAIQAMPDLAGVLIRINLPS